MSMVAIYTLSDPRRPDVVRYVGQTRRPLKIRLRGHLSEARGGVITHKCNWIRSLLAAGIEPLISSVNHVTQENWQGHEIRILASYKDAGHPLTNCTIGGEGTNGINCSPDTRAKISASNRNPSPETRAKMSASQRNLAPETLANKRAKISAAKKGSTHTPEVRELLRKISRGHIHSQETKDKMSAAAKIVWSARVAAGYHVSAEHRAKLSMAVRKAAGERTPEEVEKFGAKISAALRGRKLTPEHRAKITAAQLKRTSEHQARISAARKRYFANRSECVYGPPANSFLEPVR